MTNPTDKTYPDSEGQLWREDPEGTHGWYSAEPGEPGTNHFFVPLPMEETGPAHEVGLFVHDRHGRNVPPFGTYRRYSLVTTDDRKPSKSTGNVVSVGRQSFQEKIDRIQAQIDLPEFDENGYEYSELTLAGNGINRAEAQATLRWVLKVLKDEETQP